MAKSKEELREVRKQWFHDMVDKTEHIHPQETVKSVQFWS